jgi:hypothetical protein
LGDDVTLRTAINPYGVVGFGLASAFAVAEEWSLPEFCWSTWLAGLVYSWGCIGTASIQIILSAQSDRAGYEERLPILRRVSPNVLALGVAVISVSVGLLAFRIYGFLFGFYGLFLSVFAEMEPVSLFGRNGFINSDFFTPLMHLLDRFWPMVVGVLITNWKDFLRRDPWRRIVLPLQREIVRTHVMILALPFGSLIGWALLGDAYQAVTIVFLMALFYLLKKKTPRDDLDIKGNSSEGLQTPQ